MVDYRVKINGDLSGFKQSMASAGHMVKELGNNEVIVSFNYDGNLAELNKVWQSIINKHPDITVQLQYEVNKKALSSEMEKLKSLESFQLDFDVDKAEGKVEKLTRSLKNILQKRMSLELDYDGGISKEAKIESNKKIEKRVSELSRYRNTMKTMGYKSSVDMIKDGFLIKTGKLAAEDALIDELNNNISQMFAKRLDSSDYFLDEAKLMTLVTNKTVGSSEEIEKTKARIHELTQLVEKYEASLKNGGTSNGLVADLSKLEDYAEKLVNSINEIRDSLSKLSGDSFESIRNSIENVNQSVNRAIEFFNELENKRREIANAGLLGSDEDANKWRESLLGVVTAIDEIKASVAVIASKEFFDESTLQKLRGLLDSIKITYAETNEKVAEGHKEAAAAANKQAEAEKDLADAESKAAEAAAEVVDGAYEATAKKQKSSSPSKVAEQLGEYWGVGYANGIKKHKGDVEEAVRQLVMAGKLTAEDLQSDLDNLLAGNFKGRYKALQNPLESILTSMKASETKTDDKNASVKMKDYMDAVRKVAKAKYDILWATNHLEESTMKGGTDQSVIDELNRKLTDARQRLEDAKKAAEDLFKAVSQPFDLDKLMSDASDLRAKSLATEAARHNRIVKEIEEENAKKAGTSEVDMSAYAKIVEEAVKAKLDMIKIANKIDEQQYKRTGDFAEIQALKTKLLDAKNSFEDAQKAAENFFKSINQSFDSDKFLSDAMAQRAGAIEKEKNRHDNIVSKNQEKIRNAELTAFDKNIELDWAAAIKENKLRDDWAAAIKENDLWNAQHAAKPSTYSQKEITAATTEQIKAYKELYALKLKIDVLDRNTNEGNAKLALLRDQQKEQIKIINDARKITQGTADEQIAKDELANIKRRYKLEADVIKARAQDKANKEQDKAKEQQIKSTYDEEKRLLKQIYDLKIKNISATETEVEANNRLIQNLGKQVGVIRKTRGADETNADLERQIRDYVSSRKMDVYNAAQNKIVKDATAQNKSAIKEYRQLISMATEYYTLLGKQKAGTATELEKLRVAELASKWDEARQAKGKYAMDSRGSQESIDALAEKQAKFKNIEDVTALRFATNFDNMATKLEEWGNDETTYVTKLRKEMDKLSDDIKQFNSTPIDLQSEDALKMIATLQARYDELLKRMRSSSEKLAGIDSIEKFNLKVQKFISDNSAMTTKYRRMLEGLLVPQDAEVTVSQLRQMTAQFVNLEGRIIRAGQVGKSFFDTLRQRIVGLNAQLIAYYFSWMDWIRYTRQSFNLIKELDYAMVDLRKTTKMNNAELDKFYYGSNKIAKELGVTTKEVIEQASAWSRLGYSTKEESETMAKMSSKFATISPGMSTDEAQSGLISIMKAYDVMPDDVSRKIMDNINQIGNNFATSNKEIVAGLERSSASMAAANNTFEETVALFTAGQEITQDAEKMGNALRTISMRIRGYDEESEELSKDLENITGDIADLTKTASKPYGISLFTDKTRNTYKSTYDILQEISIIWDELEDKQQAKVIYLSVQKCA